MSHLLLIIVSAILLISIITAAVVLATRSRPQSSDEQLNKEYTYRKEPHGDEMADAPNRLSDDDQIPS